jgi:hypothetical protein
MTISMSQVPDDSAAFRQALLFSEKRRIAAVISFVEFFTLLIFLRIFIFWLSNEPHLVMTARNALRGLRQTTRDTGLDRKTIRAVLNRQKVKTATLAKLVIGLQRRSRYHQPVAMQRPALCLLPAAISLPVFRQGIAGVHAC